MSKQTHLIIAAIVAALLIYQFASCRKSEVPPLIPPPVEAPTPTPEEREARIDQNLAADKGAEAQRLAIAAAEVKRDQREAAMARTRTVQNSVLLSRSAVWESMLASNRTAMIETRKAAAKTPGKSVPCPVCKASSYMPCLVCATTAKPGVCTVCNGTGKNFNDLCPACIGSGKCFSCGGTKVSVCAFCDDGEIFSDTPMPERFLKSNAQ
ncbi:MAG: hypothetical protein HZA89_09835 [Verrucomicrobia bacterium]|nr:hypothetical protein [Verrucomicrobiota bacterium]